MADDARQLLDQVKAAMLRRGASQRDVAASCGTSQAQISRVLSGSSALSQRMDRRLRIWLSSQGMPSATEARVVELVGLLAASRPDVLMHLIHLLEHLVGAVPSSEPGEPGD